MYGCLAARSFSIFHTIARRAVQEHTARQDMTELSLLLDLVAAARPEVIVEIGCDVGGTLYAWRQVCHRVIGVSLILARGRTVLVWGCGGQSG